MVKLSKLLVYRFNTQSTLSVDSDICNLKDHFEHLNLENAQIRRVFSRKLLIEPMHDEKIWGYKFSDKQREFVITGKLSQTVDIAFKNCKE